MSKLTIKSRGANDAEIYIDGNRLNWVKSLSLNMSAGGYPIAKIEVICTDGVDIDLPDAVVMTGGEITPNDDGTVNISAVEIQGNTVDINADGMSEKLESIGISIIKKGA